MSILKTKRALVTGIANERSIAWGIATALAEHGAEVALSYSSERLRTRAEKCARACDTEVLIECDVASDDSIASLRDALSQKWDSLDILVHSIAFAPREELVGDFVDCTTRAGFQAAHDISAYSLIALAKAMRPMMRDRQASIITLSYIGAEKAIPNYNVMGLAKSSLEAAVRYCAQSLGPESTRVNAISAGPIKTLAASGISGFREMLEFNHRHCPLRRELSPEDVGRVAVFLSSELSACVTGEIIFADNGYHAIGIVGQ